MAWRRLDWEGEACTGERGAQPTRLAEAGVASVGRAAVARGNGDVQHGTAACDSGACSARSRAGAAAAVGGGCGLNGDKLKQAKEGSGRGAHSELGGAVEEAGGGLERSESTMTDGDVCDGDVGDGGRTRPPRSNPIA